MLVYRCEELIPIGYIDSDFQSDLDFRKSTSGCVFTLGGGAKSWRSVKQSCTADSTMRTEYVVAYKVANEAAWLKKVLWGKALVKGSARLFAHSIFATTISPRETMS